VQQHTLPEGTSLKIPDIRRPGASTQLEADDLEVSVLFPIDVQTLSHV